MLPHHEEEALVDSLGREVAVAAGADCALRRALRLQVTQPSQSRRMRLLHSMQAAVGMADSSLRPVRQLLPVSVSVTEQQASILTWDVAVSILCHKGGQHGGLTG